MDCEQCVLIADVRYILQIGPHWKQAELLGLRVTFTIAIARLQYRIGKRLPVIIERCDTLPSQKRLQEIGRNVLESYVRGLLASKATVTSIAVQWRD